MAAATLARRPPPDDAVALALLPERIARHVVPNEHNGCLEWNATRVSGGYGRITYHGKSWLAHRLAFELARGPIGDKCVLHRCDNPSCVNVAHLFLGTPKENSEDRNKKGRAAFGEKNGLAKLSADDVREIRQDQRSDKEIASEYGVAPSCIWSVKKMLTWRHLQ